MKKRVHTKYISCFMALIFIVSCMLITTATAADEQPALVYSGWSLTLQNDLSLNYAVDQKYFTEYGYESPSVTFTMGERTVTVTEYNTVRYPGYYIFTLTDIAPHQLSQTVSATMSATYGGETVTTEAANYSVKQYCYNTLSNTSDTELKSLIVDLLNYGAATQTYVGNTDALVNSELTDEQKGFGTQTDVGIETIANSKYETVADPSAQWLGAYLTLVDTVEMKFVFNAESIDGLKVKVSTKDPLNAEAAGNDYYVTEFESYADGGYIATFDRFDATQMRTAVYVTVLDGEANAVSNTYRYSIESYAYAKQSDEDENLVALVKAMMKYGDAARAYCPHTTIGTKVDHEDHFTGCLDCALENDDREAHTLVDGVCSVCKAKVIEKEGGGWTVEYMPNGKMSITVDDYDAEGNFVSRSYRFVFEGYAPDSDDSDFGDYIYQ